MNRLFKCFKMQITAGLQFSLPPLVKTKVEAGLPKSHRAAVCFSGARPRRHWLRRDLGLRMASSQIDRASWAFGGAGSVATRIGSPSPRQGWGVGRRGQGDPDVREAAREPGTSPQGLKEGQRRSCCVAKYLSSYGQWWKGGDQRPESGWGGKTRHSVSWPMLSKFWRDGDCQSKTVLIGAWKWLLGQEIPSQCSGPLRILWFSSSSGSWPLPDVRIGGKMGVGMSPFRSYFEPCSL